MFNYHFVASITDDSQTETKLYIHTEPLSVPVASFLSQQATIKKKRKKQTIVTREKKKKEKEEKKNDEEK